MIAKMSTAPQQDKIMTEILAKSRVIALVGASAKPERPSYQVMAYLLAQGYEVIPVNPGMAGERILEQRCYASLSELPVVPDMVDIFRQSDHCPPLVQEAVSVGASYIWLQIGVMHAQAQRMANEAGLLYIEDKCTKIEHERLIAPHAP